MKNNYVAPEVKVIYFEVQDVITTSGVIETPIDPSESDSVN